MLDVFKQEMSRTFKLSLSADLVAINDPIKKKATTNVRMS